MKKKAVVLLSGGLDSATTLAIANDQKYNCYALTFNYGQRHRIEVNAAKKIARSLNVTEHKILDVDLTQIGGSALTDLKINVPSTPTNGIPDTYVPARNTIFLSFALAYAEIIQAYEIYIGVNAIDYSGYPDCRPEYIKSFTHTANLATKAAVEGNKVTIQTPLISMTKHQIIQTGLNLGLDYSLTISCYQPDQNGLACGICDSCRLRKTGFEQGGFTDPTLYL
ncbi:MAG: 7-cyano-7-deazaguanine synthase QueC [Gammaproteobacteria bacterium]|jgi:7-cyano-7-deazaguanine synthase